MICFLTYIMQVDDESLFREYYELKQESGIPFLYFYYKLKHIKDGPRMSPRKFYLKYKKWLMDNHLEDIYHSTTDYILWILDHFVATAQEREKCMSIHADLKNNNLKPPFTELCVGISIFTLSTTELNILSITEEIGLKPETVSRCRTWINDHMIQSKSQSINTYPVFSEQ